MGYPHNFIDAIESRLYFDHYTLYYTGKHISMRSSLSMYYAFQYELYPKPEFQ